MRTGIFLGLIIIAHAIRKEALYEIGSCSIMVIIIMLILVDLFYLWIDSSKDQ